MPALKDRHLVVSRSKDHREIYETVSEWLNTTNYFKWTDDSVTYNDELEGVELKRRRLLLRRRIETCSCVVLFAEMYEEYREWQVVALVTECDSDGNAVISLRNKFRTGDTVELVGPDLRPFSMTVPEMRDEAGTVIEEPRNPQMLLKLRLPRPVPPMTLVRHQVELSAK